MLIKAEVEGRSMTTAVREKVRGGGLSRLGQDSGRCAFANGRLHVVCKVVRASPEGVGEWFRGVGFERCFLRGSLQILGAKRGRGSKRDEAVARLQWPFASAENICIYLLPQVGRYLAGRPPFLLKCSKPQLQSEVLILIPI
jgi:hypothetical protein